MLPIMAIGITIIIILLAGIELIDASKNPNICQKCMYWVAGVGFISLYVYIEYLCR